MRLSQLSTITICVLIPLFIASCGAPTSRSSLSDSARDAVAFCVQTFNAYGPAYSSKIPERTAEWGRQMAASPCSIVQSQEVWSQEHFNLARKHLGKSLPRLSSVRFDDFSNRPASKSGLALFTDEILEASSFEAFEVNEEGVFDSVRGMLGVIKGMGFSELTLRNRQARVNLINAHTHPQSQVIRLAQLTQLTEAFARRLSPSAPLILTGDLNFTPSSLEYLFLKNVLLVEDAYASIHGGYSGGDCTYCANNPHHWGGGDRVIDYILTRSAASTDVRSVKSVINLREAHGITPSDHYGIQAGLAIKDRAPAEVAPDEFRIRATRAIIAIDQTLRILENESDRRGDLDSSIQYLREIRSSIETNNRLEPIVSNLWIP
jgi:hypothetical protein